MAYEHKPGSFSLFKNDKGDNPKRPDYTGTGADLEGNAIKVSAWIKEGGKGKFMSCNFQLAQEARDAAPTASRPNKKDPKDLSDLNSDIPF